MSTYKTKGIVLKRSNFGEADRLLTIFTEKYGLIRVIAKGVKKPLSKLAGHIELFCLTDFLIVEGKNLDLLTGAEIRKCFFNLRDNIAPTSKAFYLAEIVIRMLPESEPHPNIFKLFDDVLENLNSQNSDLLVVYFEINILNELGYLPELHKCVGCGEKLKEQKNYFNYETGGLVCEDCRGTGKKITDETIKMLRLFLSHNIKIIDKIKADKKVLNEIKNLTSEYLTHIHQKEFNSRRFLTN